MFPPIAARIGNPAKAYVQSLRITEQAQRRYVHHDFVEESLTDVLPEELSEERVIVPWVEKFACQRDHTSADNSEIPAGAKYTLSVGTRNASLCTTVSGEIPIRVPSISRVGYSTIWPGIARSNAHPRLGVSHLKIQGGHVNVVEIVRILRQDAPTLRILELCDLVANEHGGESWVDVLRPLPELPELGHLHSRNLKESVAGKLRDFELVDEADERNCSWREAHQPTRLSRRECVIEGLDAIERAILWMLDGRGD